MSNREKKEKQGNKMAWHIPKLHFIVRILIYMMSVVSGVLSMIAIMSDTWSSIFGYIIYTAAGCMLVVSCIYIVPDIRNFFRHIVKPWIEGTPLTLRLTTDMRYRTLFFTMFSFVMNILYALLNGGYGIYYRSWWFGTLSAYYIVLTFMRSTILIREKKNQGMCDAKKEWLTCRHCGISILFLDIALMGSVILVVAEGNSKSYPDLLIYAVAAYTFYKITISIMNLFRLKKMRDPSVAAVRCIGFADALMSILSLQTAMFVSFGDGTDLKVWMNALTGAVICVLILGLGIAMMIGSGRKIRYLENK